MEINETIVVPAGGTGYSKIVMCDGKTILSFIASNVGGTLTNFGINQIFNSTSQQAVTYLTDTDWGTKDNTMLKSSQTALNTIGNGTSSWAHIRLYSLYAIQFWATAATLATITIKGRMSVEPVLVVAA